MDRLIEVNQGGYMNSNDKFKKVVEAIMEDKFGNLEFIINQYISEFGNPEEYVNEHYKLLEKLTS